MADGTVYRGVVVESSTTTGKVVVIIPAVAGGNRFVVSKVGREPVDGVWKVPPVNSVVLLTAEDRDLTTLFLVPTYTYDADVRAVDFYGDFHGPVVVVARNDTGTTIPAGKVVYDTADGQELVIDIADANDIGKMPVLGITVEDIAPNARGKVAVAGFLAPFDTSALAAGIDIYASTVGGLTTNPVGLAVAQIVAKVVEVGPQGSLVVNVYSPTVTGASGNFNGIFSGTIYASGGVLGGSTQGWVIEPNRIESYGAGNKIILDGADGEIYIGAYGIGASANPATPFYVNKDGMFSLGDRLVWNGSNLDLSGTVTADAGTIGGWVIAPGSLTSGSAGNYVALSSSGGSHAIWAGSPNSAIAPFSVTRDGVFTAASASIQGTITATAGSIGGWTVSGNKLQSSGTTKIVLDGQTTSGSVTSKIYVGNENWANPANGFYVDNAGKFGLGDNMTWDPTGSSGNGLLLLSGQIDAQSATLANWSLDPYRLYAGTAGNYIELNSNPFEEYRTWAGHPSASVAPFRVKGDGTLIASNASIRGSITSSSISGSIITGGSITGNQITGGSLTGGFISGGSVSGGYITGGSVVGGFVSGGSVSGGYITGGSIVATSMSGSTITGGSITGNTITGGSVVGGFISGGSVSGGYITGGSLVGGVVSGNSISGGTISGTSISGGTLSGASVVATQGQIGGWTIGPDTLTGGNASLSSTGVIRVGTSSSTAGLSANDPSVRIWAGATNPSAGPFQVDARGYMTSASTTLNIYQNNVIYGRMTVAAPSGSMALGASVSPGNNNGLYISPHNYWYDTGEFKVGSASNYVSWNGATLGVVGNITATSGSFNGAVNASAGSFTGTVFASAGSFAGAVYATTGSFAGDVYATNGSFNGQINATSASIGGFTTNASAFTGPSVGLIPGSFPFYAGNTTASLAPFRVNNAGALVASNASINGTINASAGSFSGTITASSINGASISSGFVTGASIVATQGQIGGWTLGATSLSSGNVGLAPGSYPFYAGGSSPATALFRVDTTGNLVASNASLTGASVSGRIVASSGNIGGWEVGGTGSSLGGPTSGQQPGSWPFFSGGSTPALATFKVNEAGQLFASGASISGTITGSSISATNISGGNISGTNIFGGNISGGAVFTGSITGSSIDISTGASGFRVNTSGQMWMGSTTAGSATPLLVDSNGTIKLFGKNTSNPAFYGTITIDPNDGANHFGYPSIIFSGSASAPGLIENKATTANLVIKSTNNVEIGTPAYPLLIVANNSGTVTLGDAAATTTVNGSNISITSNGIRTVDGSAATPSFSFSADTNTGMYRVGTDAVGITAGGSELIRFSSSNNIRIIDGTLANPAINFINDANSGLYRRGNDDVWLVSNGIAGVGTTNGEGATTAVPTAAGTTMRNEFGFMRVLSSKRESKTNIETLDPNAALSIVDKLTPKTFLFKPFPHDRPEVAELRQFDTHIGFIAEEVAEVSKQIGIQLHEASPPPLPEVPEGATDEEIKEIQEERFRIATDLEGYVPSFWKETHMIALCVASIKALKEQVDQLKEALG